MEYNFREIEKRWQQQWKDSDAYKVNNNSAKPKYYVLDMFPYPSGAGLHVGHPLGYIASDIFARYKRLKGFNVLHPMGYDAFGLPAEQYAIDHGIHPAVSTENNINTFRKQLDNIGFCYDWSREIRTSEPGYYKWTQWIFLQLFKSWYNRATKKAESIDGLIETFEREGNGSHEIPNVKFQIPGLSSAIFSAEAWNGFDEFTQQSILMEYRLAYCGYGEVNWCEALGTVLANDEVINGVSERGGFPVVKKKLRQWYLRITEYADRLQGDLDSLAWSDAMKEMQTNWIGKSSGAEIQFALSGSPRRGEGGKKIESGEENRPGFGYAKYKVDNEMSFENAKRMRNEPTIAESMLWQNLKNKLTGYKFRRQHPIENAIVDFVCLDLWLIVEVDGEYHANAEQKLLDEARDLSLKNIGFTTLRFNNDEVIGNIGKVVQTIKGTCDSIKKNSAKVKKGLNSSSPLQGEAGVRVYTTRPDTIFGVDFMVLAPEHELVEGITSAEQKGAVEEYIAYVKSRSERERMAEKKISGCFTGAYAVNPLSGKEIPIWISEYVLAGYGTGAIMAVPCGDERDHKFAKHFNIPITNIIGDYYNGEEANPAKDAVLQNSGFLDGTVMRDAAEMVIEELEDIDAGIRKINYKMRDAAFSRQRYWGEPFPIIWRNGMAYALDEKELPLELPQVDSYGPGPEGEGPLANIPDWYLIPDPSPQVEKEVLGAAIVPKYKELSPVQFELARMNSKDHTDAEKILWEELRNNKAGVKIRRQHPIEAYIVDFIALQDQLIIEIDGGYHENEEQKQYDHQRTKNLGDIGFEVIRFTNAEVVGDINAVKNAITAKIAALKESHNSSPLHSWRGAGGEVRRETNTMPGYAGSSWYFLRYMDPHNDATFCDRKVSDYWNQVDLYIGGTEHAVGHLLYSRMWTKALYDLGHIGFNEPFKKLVNQGMIQGSSRFIYRLLPSPAEPGGPDIVHKIKREVKPIFLSHSYSENKTLNPEVIFKMIYQQENISFDIPEEELKYYAYHLNAIRVPVEYVDGIELDIDKIRQDHRQEFKEGLYLKETSGKFICGAEVEKMSKSKYNTVNPDDLVIKYGADTFRMYEMFLGPVEQSKPWDTKGIEGVHRFLKKLWRLFHDEQKGTVWTDEAPTGEEMKVLHRTIKKIEEDTERFSFNTAVSAFMIAVNELTDLKCSKKTVLENLLVLLTPYAPHIAEELWQQLGNSGSILNAVYPVFEEKYIVESSKAYPVAINGKTRTEINISLDVTQQQIEEIVLADEIVQKWLEGKQPKKIIYVKNRMINVVM